MNKNKKITIISVSVVILLIIIGFWYYKFRIPYNEARKDLIKITDEIQKENEKLQKSIETGETALDTEEKPLNEDTRSNLQVAISEAKESIVEIPETPKKTEEALNLIDTIKVPDYTNLIDNINNKTKDFTDNIKQLKQVTNPSEDFIVTRLKDVDLVKNIELVTEDNDPNNNLNKPQGYTADAYFSSTLINGGNTSGKSIIDYGTNAGGSIEVYETVENAIKRNEYLSNFDGPGLLNPGSHSVLGTIVIRTSSQLTASQQKDLENKIIESFIRLD